MKKKIAALALCALLGLGMTGCSTGASAPEAKRITLTSAEEALDELKAGNAEFLKGNTTSLRKDLAENGQTPYAVVITCSDARVAPEVLFNTTMGEIFTIRTAGNVVDKLEMGSVEYGAEHLGAPLIVVMGHSGCGAVGAAMEGEAEGYIQDIVDEIAPSVMLAKLEESDLDAARSLAEDLNVQHTINKLQRSAIIKELVEEGKVQIIGAKYDIVSGEVTYFDTDAADPEELVEEPAAEEVEEPAEDEAAEASEETENQK